MKIKALAPWFGAKRNLAPKIVELLGKHRVYWEPFCGSMAVLLAKPPCVMETVCDLHGDLINLARVLQKENLALELYGRLVRTLMSEDLFNRAAEWEKYRAENRKKLSPSTVEKQLAKLAEYSVAEAIAAINKSIESSWQGLFPESKQGGDHKTKPKLLPIVGKTCSLQGCRLPAVYKDTSGSYDYYRCMKHLPKEVKEIYG